MSGAINYILHKLDELQMLIAKLSQNDETQTTWASKNISSVSTRIDSLFADWIKPVSDKLDKHLEYHPMPIQNSIETLKDNQENIYRQIDLLKERMDALEGKRKK